MQALLIVFTLMAAVFSNDASDQCFRKDGSVWAPAELEAERMERMAECLALMAAIDTIDAHGENQWDEVAWEAAVTGCFTYNVAVTITQMGTYTPRWYALETGRLTNWRYNGGNWFWVSRTMIPDSVVYTGSEDRLSFRIQDIVMIPKAPDNPQKTFTDSTLDVFFVKCSTKIEEYNNTLPSFIDTVFSAAALSNHDLCQLAMFNCPGELKPFHSVEECVAYYDELPGGHCTSEVLLGNTTGCRHLHLMTARLYPEKFCHYLGPRSPVCVEAGCTSGEYTQARMTIDPMQSCMFIPGFFTSCQPTSEYFDISICCGALDKFNAKNCVKETYSYPIPDQEIALKGIGIMCEHAAKSARASEGMSSEPTPENTSEYSSDATSKPISRQVLKTKECQQCHKTNCFAPIYEKCLLEAGKSNYPARQACVREHCDASLNFSCSEECGVDPCVVCHQRECDPVNYVACLMQAGEAQRNPRDCIMEPCGGYKPACSKECSQKRENTLLRASEAGREGNCAIMTGVQHCSRCEGMACLACDDGAEMHEGQCDQPGMGSEDFYITKFMRSTIIGAIGWTLAIVSLFIICYNRRNNQTKAAAAEADPLTKNGYGALNPGGGQDDTVI